MAFHFAPDWFDELSVRMRRAALKLATSSQPVSSIAFDNGFGDLSTINRRFRELFAMSPKAYSQFYFYKVRGLNSAMTQRAKQAGVNVMMLTVDSISGGNRERNLRTGFSIPFKLTLSGMTQFAM